MTLKSFIEHVVRKFDECSLCNTWNMEGLATLSLKLCLSAHLVVTVLLEKGGRLTLLVAGISNLKTAYN